MTETWLPAQDYAGITQERLFIVGDLIRTARETAADDHHPEDGETNWTLGVSGFERTCAAVAAASPEYPWLDVVSGACGGPVRFVMTVGGHPIRFFHGDPNAVPARYQQLNLPELVELQHALDMDDGLPTGRCLRIAIENDVSGRPECIYLVELDSATGSTKKIYLIPSLAEHGSVAEFVQPVDEESIPPVSAEPVDDAAQVETQKTGSEHE